MEISDPADNILRGVTVPETGLVLLSTWGGETPLLSRRERRRIVQLAEEQSSPVCGSTDWNGHWAEIVQVSPAVWVARHVNLNCDDEEYLLFTAYTAAYAHYEQVVRGQQDATGGTAWRECDVPGVLAGEDLRLAVRVGYSYEDAARQYAEDRDAALSAWATLDALSG